MGKFRDKIKKVSEPREHKITNCYGIADAYRFYRQEHKELKNLLNNTDYRKLIDQVNLEIVEALLSTGEVKFPLEVGTLRIYKRESKPKIVDGELVYYAPINWRKTLELWEKDPTSKVAKTLVKRNPGDVYSIRYRHRYHNLKNKEYMMFRPNRSLKQALQKRILENKESIPYFERKI